jgi:hypothetical protein
MMRLPRPYTIFIALIVAALIAWLAVTLAAELVG